MWVQNNNYRHQVNHKDQLWQVFTILKHISMGKQEHIDHSTLK